jgi:hypothetical protein
VGCTGATGGRLLQTGLLDGSPARVRAQLWFAKPPTKRTRRLAWRPAHRHDLPDQPVRRFFLLSLRDHATGGVATRHRSRTSKPAQTSIKKRAAGKAGLRA